MYGNLIIQGSCTNPHFLYNNLKKNVFPHYSDDKDSSEVSADDFFTGQGSPAAVHRLIAGKSDISTLQYCNLSLAKPPFFVIDRSEES